MDTTIIKNRCGHGEIVVQYSDGNGLQEEAFEEGQDRAAEAFAKERGFRGQYMGSNHCKACRNRLAQQRS